MAYPKTQRPCYSILRLVLTGGQPVPILAVKEAGKGRIMSLGVDSSWRWSFSEAVEGEGEPGLPSFLEKRPALASATPKTSRSW